MKKITIGLLVFLTLTLSAGAGVVLAKGTGTSNLPAATVNQSLDQVVSVGGTNRINSASDSTGLNTDYDNAESIVTQLIVGSLQLKGTDLAITKEQAATLLPLWNEYNTLLESAKPQGTPAARQEGATPVPQTMDTATQQKMDDLTTQIAAAMTTEQINAIVEMKITRETAMSVMKEYGVTMGGPQNGGGDGQTPQGTPPAGGNGGGGGNGTPPPGGKPGGDGQMGGQQPGGGIVPSEFVSVLIQMLQETSGA